VARKFAILGASLVAFDPRLMINSFFGITDPLYLLLISSGLALFLSSNKKLVISSFFVISLATTVRGEGIVFLAGLFILFFIKYKKEKYKIIFNYIIIIIIITIILLPVTMYRIDTDGKDPIFTRTISSANDALSKITVTGENDWKNDNVNDRILNGFKTLIQYLVWITIPNFVIFLPLGIFLIFKNRNFEKNTIIISAGLMLIPALYAYTFPVNPALDTRYLYLLFPIFSVLAVISVEKIIGKINRANLMIIIIIIIILSSIIFYDYKKIDYDHEKESFEIMKDVLLKVKGVNNLPTESRYLSTIQTINQWPTPYSEIEFNIEIISYQNENNLQDWISKSKDKGLTHILIDDNKQRPDFLKEIFFEETKYTYLKKIYDSKNEGFNYQLKVFEINYELFESLKDNIHT
jgi:4-amino-4-deoxy-L-arabinose transferase-like glycosyltransferase